jgi:hypothetical protein
VPRLNPTPARIPASQSPPPPKGYTPALQQQDEESALKYAAEALEKRSTAAILPDVSKCGKPINHLPAVIKGVNATATGESHANMCL